MSRLVVTHLIQACELAAVAETLWKTGEAALGGNETIAAASIAQAHAMIALVEIIAAAMAHEDGAEEHKRAAENELAALGAHLACAAEASHGDDG